jgi:Concanavalin A-like lectin/glucanases superfamily
MPNYARCAFALMFIAAYAGNGAVADTRPEILHYRFNDTGLTTSNSASNPPPNTATAFLGGGFVQTGADLNLRGDGNSLVSPGALISVVDFLNTQWVPDLPVSSWTISFVTQGIPAAQTAQYAFGELNNRFRCFTGGVAGSGNWILRGTFVTDVVLPGGASMERRRSTFVYDFAQNRIIGYVDGTQVADVAQAGAPAFFNASEVFKVGGYGGGNGSAAAGATLPAGALLDDFRFYSRALSAQEVAEIDRYSIVAVSGNAVIILDGDSTPDAADGTDFGGALIGMPVERTFTVENGGDLPMTLDAVTIDGLDAVDFSVVAQTTSPVAAGAASTFTVRFVPSVLGPRNATVRFGTDDPDVASFDFAVRGNSVPDAVFENGFEG